jgi:polysaccharide biosynthesis/export protein
MIMPNLKRIVSAPLLVVVALLLAGCPGGSVSDSGLEPNGEFQATGGGQKTPIGGKAAADAQRIFAEGDANINDPKSQDYKISALDVVEVSVFGVKDLDRTVQVSSSGMITMPLINQVKAGGRTSAQLEAEIARKLNATYLQNPQVSVYVKEYNSQRITVDGAVMKPGIFPITGKVTLLQAVALAEGLNEIADPSGILLFRTVDGKRMIARFNLKEVRGGKIDDPFLQAGDIVMVDESSTRTTLREIKNVMPITGLFQLLAL